jgi:dienelactone hydrolase
MAAPVQAEPVVGVDKSCFAHAESDPAPGTPEWHQRDTHNQYCSTLRVRDQLLSPAFGFGNLTQGASLYAEQWVDQLAEPSHPHGGITTLIPGSKSADPFRTIKRWTDAGRGRVAPVKFKALNGSQLRGHVFIPPAGVKKPKRGYPGVVITDGSVQAYEELYFWAAQDLAEAGYMVMTYDVQGQGDSDLFGEDCPGECSGVPYQQDYNFFQGAEDSLSFFLSSPGEELGGSHNPYADSLDRRRVGIAGHSLGASAVSHVGQCDKRVKAIVAWDNLRRITDCSGVTIPERHRSEELINTPALAITNDYAFNPQPMSSPPDPHAKDAGYQQVAKAGLDAQIIALRNATHLTYSYIPLVLPANELGERMASYYTLAWFDLQLRGRSSGFDRLTATAFDGSADVHATGAGVYDAGAADPADPYSGNVPYEIEGIPVEDAVSFYYLSSYSLRNPESERRATCADMRAGCAQPKPHTRRGDRRKR